MKSHASSRPPRVDARPRLRQGFRRAPVQRHQRLPVAAEVRGRPVRGERLLQQHACVQCLDSGDCLDLSAPNCNAAHQCVASCTADGDCAKPTPRCLVSEGSCVTCLTSEDCTAPLQCDPVQYICLSPSATTCTKEQDCATNSAAPHCKPGTGGKPGTCVACLDDSQCPAGEICNLQNNTCV